jgi:hypothetical protein
MIYTTFKQWVKGRFLETGEPRKQAYSKDELALIEMGWGYGYDAGVEAEREACAKLLETTDLGGLKDNPAMQSWVADMLLAYVKAIRARGQA